MIPFPPDTALTSRFRWGLTIGASAIVLASASDILLTLQGMLGFVETRLVRDYLAGTRHGNATLLRLGLVLVVIALALLNRRARTATVEGDDQASFAGPGKGITNTLFVLVGVMLLGTFSWTSHAAAMGGTPPLLADLVHYGAAAAWAGPIFYLAFTPRWDEMLPAMRIAFRRISRIGLASVLLLFLTGTYTALIHMQDPERFVTSPFGWALGAKLGVVLLRVAIAAANRLWLLPAFVQGNRPERFQNAVRTEAMLLVAVFLLTGLLTTSALPHDPSAQPSALENLVRFLRFLTGR